MTWRVAKSLAVLFQEFNALAPHRSKAYDGTIGDAAHQARATRHNPNDAGVVCAGDVTHDPAHGCDVHAIVRAYVKSGHVHPDLAYVISNRQVFRRTNGWKAAAYTGANPHDHHAHWAVGLGPDSEPRPPYDDTTPWGIAKGLAPVKPPAPKETLEAWMNRTIFKPRDSELSGAVILQMEHDYGLKPLWVLVVTGAETSCGRRSDGAIVTEAHNYGCIRESNYATKWGSLAVPNAPLVLPDGRKFFQFPDVWKGTAALGRLLKVGPTSNPGGYLKMLQVRDWHSFALTYYGKDVPGVKEYETNLLNIEAGFRLQAKAAGWNL